MLIAFDCDGVILDSNGMKCDAFAHALQGYPAAAVEPFLAFQRRNFGTSRYRLIDRFFEDYLGRPPEGGERDAVLRRFAAECRRHYPLQPFTDGARETIDELGRRGHRLAVVSGSDESELRDVFEELCLTQAFAAGIHGSPRSKVDHLTALQAVAGAGPLLFIGDAAADWQAAVATRTGFVGIATWSADPDAIHSLSAEHGFPLVGCLSELLDRDLAFA